MLSLQYRWNPLLPLAPVLHRERVTSGYHGSNGHNVSGNRRLRRYRLSRCDVRHAGSAGFRREPLAEYTANNKHCHAYSQRGMDSDVLHRER
jgi:hypothetical protein